MASNIETGHSVNISNFKLLIDKCSAFGTSYNPSNADLSIVNITKLWTTGDAAHQTLTSAIQSAKNPINARQILFEPVDKLTTRTLNYFKSTKASSKVISNAKGLADRYRGYGVKIDKLTDGTPDPKSVSTSHQSFIQKADTFKQLVDLYHSDSNYSPNEPDLKIASLTALANSMKTINNNIGTIIAPIDVARITRDKALYAKETGIIDVSNACKRYVKGVFGAIAAETKTVSGIKFTRKQ